MLFRRRYLLPKIITDIMDTAGRCIRHHKTGLDAAKASGCQQANGLGWKARISLRDEIGQSYEWYVSKN
jgi:hypothetical protein